MRCIPVALLVALTPVAAAASLIVSTTGAVEEISAPASVVEEALESDSKIRAFVERSDFELPSAVDVDVTAPGSYGASPGTSSIDALTRVASVLLHMDSVDTGDGGTSAPLELSGSIRFSAPVIGIIGLTAKLDASDGVVGSPSTTYPVGDGTRGFWEAAESITLSADRLTVTLTDMRVHNDFVDQVRLLLMVPEPATGALVALGTLLLALTQHRGRSCLLRATQQGGRS